MADIAIAWDAFADHAWAIAVDVALKATVLLVAALILDRVLRGRHLLACSSMWNACLIGLALLPLAAFAFPRLRIECLPPKTTTAKSLGTPVADPKTMPMAELRHLEFSLAADPTVAQTTIGPIVRSVEPQIFWETIESRADLSVLPPDAAAALPSARRQSVPWQSWLLCTYFVGVAILTLGTVRSLHAVRRLRRISPALTDARWTNAMRRWCRKLAVEPPVRLAHSREIDTPVVIGWRQPIILVPTPMVSTVTAGQRDAILVHELAHIQRADYPWQLLLKVLQIAYWFHPSTWITTHSIRNVRERACDDYCVHWLGDRGEYGTALLDLARRMVRCRGLALGLAAVRLSTIEQRLAHIDQSSGFSQCLCRLRLRTMLLVMAMVSTILVGSLELCRVEATADEPEALPQTADEPKDQDTQTGKSAMQLYKQISAAMWSRDLDTAVPAFVQLESTFPSHNRTGCAALYLGQMYRLAGDDNNAEAFFRRAINQYPHCRYGDHVQVGAYATFLLADLLRDRGNTTEANLILSHLLNRYPNAIDHRRRPLAESIREVMGSSAPDAETNYPPLEFALTDVFGRQVRSSDYAGKPLLLQFGACWCGGCQQDARPLGELAARFGPKGLHVVRCVAGENELTALEFMQHYRLPIVHLMDVNRTLERRYNQRGWPFLVLVNGDGKVVYTTNASLVQPNEDLTQAIQNLLLDDTAESATTIRDGVLYAAATLARSGESQAANRRDRFPSMACGPDGRIYVVFTSNRNGNSDVFLRVFDGENWSPDRAVASTEADEYDGSVLVDQNNRVWVTWTSNAGGKNYNVFVASMLDPTGPGDPRQLTHADDDAMHARMACDRNGRIWVTYYKWHRMGNFSRDKEVYVKRFDGADWSNEIHVSPDDVPQYEDHTDPAIIPYAGGVAVCWSWDFHPPQGYSGNARTPTVFLRTIDENLKLGEVTTVSARNTDIAPAMGLDADQRIWLAWDSQFMNRSRSLASRGLYLDAAEPEWERQGAVGENLSDHSEDVCTPNFATSPSGGLALVWSELDPQESWQMKSVFLDSNAKEWTQPGIAVAEGNPRFPASVYDKGGRLWIAYSAETETGREIQMSRQDLTTK